jgi:uncharacterized membrane protein
MGWVAFSGLALGGMGVGAYLTYVHWSEADTAFCAVASGCETVNRSGYSTLGPVPVALLGALLYAALLALGLGGMTARIWAAPLATGMALFGLAFSCYLTYAEVAVLQAVCVWCLASLAIITALLLLAAAQAWLQTAATGEARDFIMQLPDV